MQISTRGRYGLRAMVDLALHSVDEYIALKSIAERQNISESYLEQLFSSLKKGGLIKSSKGPQGGYTLADHPGNITVGSALKILEGKLFTVTEPTEHVFDHNLEHCIFVHVWDKINTCVCSIVDSITLEDLVVIHNSMTASTSPMFYI